MSDNGHHTTQSLNFLISEGQLIMKALGGPKQVGKAHCHPSTAAAPSVFHNGCLLGYSHQQIDHWVGGGGLGVGEESRRFFVCAPCPCIILFSM